jgi:transcriptional regulator with GAF, ATPase, and Fis domain
MVLHAMAQTKTSKRKSPTRRTSVLAEVGAEARADAQRKVLREALDAAQWNLTAAGKRLRMSPQAVSRALQELDRATYDEAVKAGRIAGGRPAKNDV